MKIVSHIGDCLVLQSGIALQIQIMNQGVMFSKQIKDL
jgi:uncharacterized membrane protein SirB2